MWSVCSRPTPQVTNPSKRAGNISHLITQHGNSHTVQSITVEPLTNDHPHQRPSLSYDHINYRVTDSGFCSYIPHERPSLLYDHTNGSFRVNSTNFDKSSQVSVSNIAQKIPKITLVSIMKACQILGGNSEYFWRYSLSNFLFCFAFLPSRL